jgi:MoxR-like ATPase
VIATQNSVGDDHAYDLPIAELDRFMKKIALGYPEEDEEIDMLDRTTGEHPIETISPVATLRALKDAREITANISTVEHIRSYTTDIASFTREHAQMGLSPRGTMQLLRAAQARAVINGRDYVIPDDVKTEASVVIPHRIRADTDRSPKKLVREALSTVDPE